MDVGFSTTFPWLSLVLQELGIAGFLFCSFALFRLRSQRSPFYDLNRAAPVEDVEQVGVAAAARTHARQGSPSARAQPLPTSTQHVMVVNPSDELILGTTAATFAQPRVPPGSRKLSAGSAADAGGDAFDFTDAAASPAAGGGALHTRSRVDSTDEDGEDDEPGVSAPRRPSGLF